MSKENREHFDSVLVISGMDSSGKEKVVASYNDVFVRIHYGRNPSDCRDTISVYPNKSTERNIGFINYIQSRHISKSVVFNQSLEKEGRVLKVFSSI